MSLTAPRSVHAQWFCSQTVSPCGHCNTKGIDSALVGKGGEQVFLMVISMEMKGMNASISCVFFFRGYVFVSL